MDIIDAVSKRVTGMDKSIQCKYRSYYCDSNINQSRPVEGFLMEYELQDIRSFVKIAELGSFHEAAEALHLSQPALSRRIKKLEEGLGTSYWNAPLAGSA
jgi:hypothetical protein